MKILLLTDDFPPVGTSSVGGIAASLADAYRREGHDVHVLTTHRPHIDPSVRHADGVTSIPVPDPGRWRQYSVIGTRVAKQWAEPILRDFRPDAVHAHNVHHYLSYASLRSARQSGARTVLTLHDVMSFAYGRLATQRYLDSSGTNTRLTILDHLRTAGRQYNPFRNAYIRHILATSVHAVVASSNALARAAQQNGMQIDAVIPQGINAAQWAHAVEDVADCRRRYGLESRSVVYFGGRLSADKGAVALLRAVRELRSTVPSILLLVAGDAAAWEKLVYEAGAKDLAPWIRCLGWLGRDDLRRAMNAANVVATPSLCLDVAPYTNFEAMALRKPIVGTIFGGTREAVVHGITGCICDPRDTGALAGHLASILSDPARARAMGEAGGKRVEECYTLESQAQVYLRLFGGS